MEAAKEVKRLQAKIADGSLPANEPLFVIRAQDVLSVHIVNQWIMLANDMGVPAEKIGESNVLLVKMAIWPHKRIPGRPESAFTISPENLSKRD